MSFSYVNLSGWDITYGASQGIINKQLLQSQKSFLTTFNYSSTTQFLDNPINFTLNGNLSNWQVTGGSNRLITFQFTVENCMVEMSGNPLIVKSLLSGTNLSSGKPKPDAPFEISNFNVNIEVTLDFVTHSSSANTNQKNLVFDCLNDKKLNYNWVKNVNILDQISELGESLTGFMKSALGQLIGDNKDKFTYVFANIFEDVGSKDWGKAQRMAFFYNQPQGSKESYFSIFLSYGLNLKEVNATTVSSLTPSIDSTLIKNTASAKESLFKVISGPLFLKYFVLPSAKTKFGPDLKFLAPSNSAFFELTDACIIGSDIPLHSVSKGPETFHPKINSLVLSINNGCLNTTISGGCDLIAGESMTFSYESNAPIVYNSVNNSYSIQPDPSPKTSHSTHTSTSGEILKWGSIIATGGLSAGLIGIVVAAIMAEISSMIIDKLSDSIANDSNSQISGFNPIEQIPVTWTGIKPEGSIQKGGFYKNLYYINMTDNA